MATCRILRIPSFRKCPLGHPTTGSRWGKEPVSLVRVAQRGSHEGKGVPSEGPIRFTNSKAASWSMTHAKLAPKSDAPWYQPLSIAFSAGAFLVYFLFLREENDLDIELNYTLFERVPGMEEHQLKVALDYNRMYGKDTTELEKRLAEVQQSKQAQANSQKSDVQS